MSSADSKQDLRVVMVTAPDAGTARVMARTLVEARLAACVNVVSGVKSVYRWEEAVQEDEEVLLFVKTRESRCRDLEERVRAMHPYDLPEIVTLAVAGGSEPYLDWVREASSP